MSEPEGRVPAEHYCHGVGRLPYLSRDELGAGGQHVWDLIVGTRGSQLVNSDGGLAGPFNAFVHAPDVGQHIGLRAGLLGTLGFEVAAQRCFALDVGLSLEVIRNLLQDFDIRRDARGLNGVSRWRVVPRRGQPQSSIAAAERNDRLHRAFAERAGADEGGTLLVLQSAGHDFGGRCRATVDQDDQWFAFDHRPVPRSEALRLFRNSTAGRYDLALI